MKKKNSLIRLIPLALPLLFLLFSAEMCKKPDTCHRTLTMVNHSDSVVSFRTLCRFYHDQQEYVDLGLCFFYKPDNVFPLESIAYSDLSRYCLEETYKSYVIYVVPGFTPNIITTPDSLEIKYNILKKIDLEEIGVDSLLKTDFTVYYP